MRIFWITACVTGLCVSSAFAQQVLRKESAVYVEKDRTPRVGVRPPGLRLGLRKPREVALAPLSGTEVAILTGPDTRLKAGIQRKLAAHAIATGSWETTSDGTRVWHMAIRSSGSQGIRVEFTSFDAGDGRVWLHDGTTVAGPYTGRGPHDNGTFWSETVHSESAILEYEPGSNSGGLARELEPPFQIGSIVHQQRGLLRSDGAGLASSTKDPADYCEIDANCSPEWQSMVSAVGQITFIEDGQSFFCSGALVATRDNSFKPYLLTAGHCIHSEAAARTVETYWTYQTSSCGAAPPENRAASTKSTGGAHLVASGGPAEGDFSLILLSNVPAGVTFSGWDAGDPSMTSGLIGIHHPSASWKRISFGLRAPDASVSVEGSDAPGNKYLQVAYNRGRVEQGSSGSPLFSAPGVLVGSLSYGQVMSDGSVCPINPQGAGYSRFSNTYAHVKDYLENLPATLVLPDKANLSFTVANRAASAGQSIRLTTQSAGQIPYKLRSDASWIQVSAATGNASANAPSPVSITLDAAQLTLPGQYKGTVTILSGAAPPQFVNVTATVQVELSNVTATITPNAVLQSGGQWSFQIRLLETAGVATHLTAMKFNGTDYTSSIAGWFGTTQIAATGAIVAPLSGNGLFPAGDQYFEFWGVDDATGQAWYRVATVTFR